VTGGVSEHFSDEQWAAILKIAREIVELPEGERAEFAARTAYDPGIASEALKLAAELQQPAQEDSPPPSVFVGRFQLLHYLGSGGAGEVYSARDPELRRTVALKLIRRNRFNLLDAEKIFLREARTASALNHPNIVTIHEIIQTESRVAIVMEFLAGAPLRSKCGTPLEAREWMAIGRQIADGLAAAHRAGVVHRDIKPENVIVLPDGRAKILDFGLARTGGLGDSATITLHAGLPAGTLRYMSPEHVRNQKITAASDVFALGIVLYELAAGGHPFERAAPIEVLHAIANEPAARLADRNIAVPPEVEALIVAMMSKDPAARPSASAVGAALRHSGDAGAPPSVPQTAPAQKVALIAGAVLLLAVVGFLLTRDSSRPRFGVPKQVTTLVPENHPTASAVSRNGKMLAYANADGVFVQTLGSEETTRLSAPPAYAIDRLSWYSDDTGVVASGLSDETNQTSIWSLRLTAKSPTKLKTGGRSAEVSPDGTRIVFAESDYSAISVMAADGGDQRRVVSSQGEDALLFASWSGDGRWLIYQRRSHAGPRESASGSFDQHDHLSLECVSAANGAAADQIDDFPVRSLMSMPTGELFFVQGVPKQSSNGNALWRSKVDPQTGRFDRRMARINVDLESLTHVQSLSSSRDGDRIAVLGDPSRESSFVADFDESAAALRNIRELTLHGRASYPHSWTADSRAVIFESDRSGGYDIYRQSLDAHIPEPIVMTSKRWEVLPQLAPDGRTVLYAAGPPDGGLAHLSLMRVGVGGGDTASVTGGEDLEDFRCSVGTRGRCVLRKSVGRDWYIFYEIEPLRGVGRELARSRWQPSALNDWDVSPDGETVVMPNRDLRAGRLRLVSLEGGAEREVAVPEITSLASVEWTASNEAWFITVNSDYAVAPRLYLYAAGADPKSLGAIRGWAVPAPDGRRIAFLNRVVSANVWMLSRN